MMILRKLMAAVALIALVAVEAQAAPTTFVATLDPTPGFESQFTFDFGGGFLETAVITNTQFSLEVDSDASPSGAAQFLSYTQEIQPILLPDPTGTGGAPISTGDLFVEVLAGTSGVGSYDAASGEFSTSETYRIHYTGDLSAYGLNDGFVDLPSVSTGVITLQGEGGRISQSWDGTYTFPGTSISLGYTCQVNAQILVPEPSSFVVLMGLFGLIGFARR